MQSPEKAIYFVSEAGKICNYNVRSEEECQEAAKKFRLGNQNSNATYSAIQDNKNIHPRGCIFEAIIPLQHRVYWNPNETKNPTSKNYRSRKICKNAPYKSYLSGKYLF